MKTLLPLSLSLSVSLSLSLQEVDTVSLELEDLKREQAGYQQQIEAVDEALKAVQEQIEAMSVTVAANKVQTTGGTHCAGFALSLCRVCLPFVTV